MKKLIIPFVAMVSLFLLPGCSEKFDVAAPYKNITVIYGYLDMRDTAHYIRIQKAFLDQNKSALTMSQTPDSNFYANLDVTVAKISFSGTKQGVIQLNRVDLNAEGYQKQQGAFFTAPNYAYKFTDLLDPQYIYRIIVRNQATGEVDSAETPIIEDLNRNKFHVDIFDDTDVVLAGLGFASTAPNKNFEFQITYAAPSDFTFNGTSTPVFLVQPIIRFNWTDSNMLNGAKTNHYGDFAPGYAPMQRSSIFYDIRNTDLYNGIRSALGAAPENTARLLGRPEVFVYLGTNDFYKYQQNSLIQGVGLTGNEIQPTFTNIKGANVLGLYTSRAMRSGLLTLTGNTMDSLMSSPMLKAANIRGTSYH